MQVLTNAGQANAATGEQGYKDALECAAALPSALGVSPDDVMLQSTGVCVCVFMLQPWLLGVSADNIMLQSTGVCVCVCAAALASALGVSADNIMLQSTGTCLCACVCVCQEHDEQDVRMGALFGSCLAPAAHAFQDPCLPLLLRLC